MQYYYLIFLPFSLSGLLYADYKHKLFFWRSPKNALKIYLFGMFFFLLWDVTGIVLDVFSTNQEWVSGLYFFTPDMPVEELLFLSLFLLNTAIVWRLVCIRTS